MTLGRSGQWSIVFEGLASGRYLSGFGRRCFENGFVVGGEY